MRQRQEEQEFKVSLGNIQDSISKSQIPRKVLSYSFWHLMQNLTLLKEPILSSRWKESINHSLTNIIKMPEERPIIDYLRWAHTL